MHNHHSPGEPVALPPTLELPETGTVELGRDEPADLLVPVPTVSGRHALIKVEGDKVTVTDLNSTNGTFLNGEQLNPMQAVAVDLGAEVWESCGGGTVLCIINTTHVSTTGDVWGHFPGPIPVARPARCTP